MESVKQYFEAEKNESILFVFIGLATLSVAVFFLISKQSSFLKGMAMPLLMVALIQLVVGTTLWIRSPKDTVRVSTLIKENVTILKGDELPRMQKVITNFIIYRYVELGLLVLALLFMFVFKESTFLNA